MTYWDKRHAERKPARSSEYNKKRHKYLRSLINHNDGVALKLDLWNEGGNKGVFDIDKFKTFTVIGMDISTVACANANAMNPWMKLLNTTVQCLPFRDSTVDVILDISTSDHVPYQIFCDIIKDYSRILTENGELLLIFNNRLSGTPMLTDVADYWYSEDEVKEALNKYFTITLFKPYGTHPNELKHYLLKAVKK